MYSKFYNIYVVLFKKKFFSIKNIDRATVFYKVIQLFIYNKY